MPASANIVSSVVYDHGGRAGRLGGLVWDGLVCDGLVCDGLVCDHGLNEGVFVGFGSGD